MAHKGDQLQERNGLKGGKWVIGTFEAGHAS